MGFLEKDLNSRLSQADTQELRIISLIGDLKCFTAGIINTKKFLLIPTLLQYEIDLNHIA